MAHAGGACIHAHAMSATGAWERGGQAYASCRYSKPARGRGAKQPCGRQRRRGFALRGNRPRLLAGASHADEPDSFSGRGRGAVRPQSRLVVVSQLLPEPCPRAQPSSRSGHGRARSGAAELTAKPGRRYATVVAARLGLVCPDPRTYHSQQVGGGLPRGARSET